MTAVLLQLSDFKFSTGVNGYDQLSRTRAFNWAAQPRFGGRPALQFTGESARTVSISGTIFTAEGAGTKQIEELEALGAKGMPLQLVAGTGAVLGYWVINSVDSTDSYFLSDGVPRKSEFSLSLSYYGERYPDE